MLTLLLWLFYCILIWRYKLRNIFRYTVEDVIFNWTTKDNLGGQSEPVDCPTANSRLIQFALLHHSWTEEQIQHQFGTYSVLIISFHLKRHLGYFIVQTYLPCMLIVILSQVSLLIIPILTLRILIITAGSPMIVNLKLDKVAWARPVRPRFWSELGRAVTPRISAQRFTTLARG